MADVLDNAHPLIKAAIAKRAAAGLAITFRIPGRPDDFVCYPKDEATKAAWIASGERKGWKIICEAAP